VHAFQAVVLQRETRRCWAHTFRFLRQRLYPSEVASSKGDDEEQLDLSDMVQEEEDPPVNKVTAGDKRKVEQGQQRSSPRRRRS